MSVICLRDWGRLFHATCPATERALFPNSVLVYGTQNAPDVEDCSAARNGRAETGIRTLMMYSVQKPFTAACITRQSLYFIQKSICKQCSSRIAAVTESRGPDLPLGGPQRSSLSEAVIMWCQTVPQTLNCSSQCKTAQRLRQDFALLMYLWCDVADGDGANERSRLMKLFQCVLAYLAHCSYTHRGYTLM